MSDLYVGPHESLPEQHSTLVEAFNPIVTQLRDSAIVGRGQYTTPEFSPAFTTLLANNPSKG